MIKEGNLVVCKKYYKDNKYYEKPFLPGVAYEVRNVHYNIVSIYNFKDGTDGVISQYSFFKQNKDYGIYPYFYEYFMTPAEWRDYQINKILEDA